MASLEIVIDVGAPVGSSRHRCGERRSGLPAPDCPSCGTPMVCLFSLDGSDELLAGSTLPVAAVDYEVFVCLRLCMLEHAGYATRVGESGVAEVRALGPPSPPLSELARGIPAAPVYLRLLEDQSVPSDEACHNDYVSREVPPGFYHRICPYVLWGPVPELYERPCPFCGGVNAAALITDSDDRLIFLELLDGKEVASSVFWGDLDYVAVARCGSCGAFSYQLMG